MYETKEQKQPLIIKNATFITSAARADQFITPQKPMIAVCGKSNVGKKLVYQYACQPQKTCKNE